jgi:PKD repeat protein
MSKKQFEEQLRKKFEDYEMPVTPNLWMNVAKGMGSKSPLITTSYKWLIAGMIVGGGAIGTYLSLSHSSDSQAMLPHVSDSQNHSITRSEGAQKDGSSNPSFSESAINHSDDASPSDGRSNVLELNGKAANQLPQYPVKTEKGNADKENQIETSSFAAAKTHCVGAEVSFNSPSTADDVSFLWNFGDGSFSNESNPKHKYLNPGTYVVSLSVSGHKSAQINTMNMSETINILTTPKADFDWTFENIESGKPVVSIDNNSEAAVGFEWNFHDGKKSNEFKPIKSINTNGKFPISITAIHENGCKDTKIKYVSINDNSQLLAPVQTLAGEGFMPESLKDLKGSFVMSVYDNGKKIFETKTIKRPWTGIDANGRYHEVNKQYTWIIITKENNNGASNYYSGKVLLKP